MTRPPLSSKHYRTLAILALIISLLLLSPLLIADFFVSRLLRPSRVPSHRLFKGWHSRRHIQIESDNLSFCATIYEHSKGVQFRGIAVVWGSFDISPRVLSLLHSARNKGWNLLLIRGLCSRDRRFWDPEKQLRTAKAFIKLLKTQNPSYRDRPFLFVGSGFAGLLAVYCAEKCLFRRGIARAVAFEPPLSLEQFFIEQTAVTPFKFINALIFDRFKKYEKFRLSKNYLRRYIRRKKGTKIALVSSNEKNISKLRYFCEKWGKNCRLFYPLKRTASARRRRKKESHSFYKKVVKGTKTPERGAGFAVPTTLNFPTTAKSRIESSIKEVLPTTISSSTPDRGLNNRSQNGIFRRIASFHKSLWTQLEEFLFARR